MFVWIFTELRCRIANGIEQLLRYSDYNSCEYSFSSIFNWSQVHQTEVARVEDFGVIRSNFKELSYLYPFGRGDVAPVIEQIVEDAQQKTGTAESFAGSGADEGPAGDAVPRPVLSIRRRGTTLTTSTPRVAGNLKGKKPQRQAQPHQCL